MCCGYSLLKYSFRYLRHNLAFNSRYDLAVNDCHYSLDIEVASFLRILTSNMLHRAADNN